MDIGELISAFGTGYSRLPDKRPDFYTDKKRTHLDKKTFCRELLCAISTDEDIVLYENGIKTGTKRYPSAFEAYYRNKQRRSLRPIAKAIIEGGHPNEDKFKQFLGQYTTNYSKQLLLTSFQMYIPDATMESLFEDITKAFVGILKNAAAEVDKRRKPSIPEVSADENASSIETAVVNRSSNAPESTQSGPVNDNELHNLILQMESLLEGMICTGRAIAKAQTKVGHLKFSLEPHSDLWDSLRRTLDQLKTVASSLLNHYSDLYPTTRKVYNAVVCLQAKDFVMTEGEYQITIAGRVPPLHKAEDLLSDLKTEVKGVSESSKDTSSL